MGRSSRDLTEAVIPPQWAAAIVMDSLHCRKCGYDLRGLQADGRCPECGLGIWDSVQHTVDPAASRLPSLRNPRAVGDALVWLMCCMLVGMLLILSPSLGGFLEAVDSTGTRNWSARFPALTWPYAIAIELAIVWAVRTLAPPRGSEPHGAVWNDLWRIAVGLTGWVLFACLLAELESSKIVINPRQRLALHFASAAFAAYGLVGLRGVLNIVGYRSREYRRSQGGRQSIELMIAAVVAGLTAAVVQYLSRSGVLPHSWWELARAVVWVSNFMIVIGLAYLVVNAWWIRRSLRRPPPALDQVLIPQLPPDTWIPDRED